MSTRRRLAALEQGTRITKAVAKRMTDGELTAALRAAALQEQRPASSLTREQLGPARQGRWAAVSDDEVLRMLNEARAAARNPWSAQG